MEPMNESLQTRIKSLPPLPESVVKIQEICNNPKSGIQDLIGVVEKDPMLTANLLKAANSPLYGFSREIKSVAQAVSLFGMATVKGFALASAVRNSLKIDMSPYGLSAEQFADISQTQSGLMLGWYQKIDRSKMDILAPASFLIGVGHVVIAAEVIKQDKAAAFKSALEEKATETVEREFFDISGQQVTGAVFDQWRFEPAMVNAIRFSENPAEADDEIKPYAYALRVIQTAVPLVGPVTDDTIAAAAAIVEEAGLEKDAFLKATERIKAPE